MKYQGGAVLALMTFSFLAFADSAAVPAPESVPPALSPAEILNRYLAATNQQQNGFREASMEVEIEAKLPRLKKQGTFHALRQVSRLGQISYQGVRFVGDKMVKKDVIARYLTAETEAQNGQVNSGNKDARKSISISPDNYKFKYKGSVEQEGRRAHVFQLSPRKKRVGLFKGELWVDAETFLPIRESGRFVKNPSIFLKKVEFIRDYEIRDGVALPSRIDSTVYTRIVGKAELNIQFKNLTVRAGSLQAMVCPVGW